MLNSLRSFSKTWIAKILLAVLVVSFAAFGINNVITDLGGNTIARVGDEEITTREFQRAYQQQLNAAAQQLGSIPTAEQAEALGIPSAAISRLAADAAVDALAEDLGVGASDQKLGELLRQDPAFAGTLGNFERANFVQVLQQNGYSEAEYFEQLAKAAERQQVRIALLGDTVVPETAKQLINRYASDQRTIDYFVLNPASLPPVPQPTDAELADYLAANQEKFRTVETRNVDLLVFSPEILAQTIEISDEDIAAEYERTRASLIEPERRLIRQVALPDQAAVTLFQEGQSQGRSFGSLATQAGLSVTELGFLAQSQVTDARLAEAAFGLEQGEFDIIPGATGQRAVTIAAIEPGGEVPLDAAREQIRDRLALAEARAQQIDILDQIEELRAAFQPLSQIAERYNLELQSLDMTASGAELADVSGISEEDRARVAQTVFAAEPGKLAPSVRIAGNGTAWIDLKSVEPARDQTLDEVREEVAAAWTQQKTDEAIAAEVERIEEQLDAGTPIADIAASLNTFPQLSQPFERSGDGSSVINASVAGAAFSGGEDHHGSAINGDGDYVIFDVVEIIPASGEIDANLADFVTESTRDSLYAEFVNGLRNELGLRINQQALSQVLSLTGPAN